MQKYMWPNCDGTLAEMDSLFTSIITNCHGVGAYNHKSELSFSSAGQKFSMVLLELKISYWLD